MKPTLLPLFLALTIFSTTSCWFYGFVQDDIFISLRFAENLVTGNGLVFNPGERVEGITNFGWTIFAATLRKFSLPVLDILRIAGFLSGFFLVSMVWWESGGKSYRDSIHDSFGGGLAAILMASGTTLPLWSVSGLEQTFFSFLLFAGFIFLLRERFDLAVIIWLGSAIVRPEGLMALGVGFTARIFQGKICGKPFTKAEIIALTGCVGILFLLFLSRFIYYGRWLPNTYYVKGVSSMETYWLGLTKLRQFLEFNYNYLILGSAILGLFLSLSRGMTTETGLDEIGGAAFSLLFVPGYLFYMVRIGGDILPHFRLYMPILPFMCFWAGRCFSFFSKPEKVFHPPRDLMAGVLIIVSFLSIRATFQFPEFRGTLACLTSSHGSVGKFLEEIGKGRTNEKPLTVIAQDMGYTTFVAPSVRFVDVIGLTDSFMANLFFECRYTPYIRYLLWQSEEKKAGILEMERRGREYLESQNADFVIINVNCPIEDAEKLSQALSSRDTGFLLPLAQANTFFCGLASTEKFRKNFRLIAGFPFSNVHALLLFQKQSFATSQ